MKTLFLFVILAWAALLPVSGYTDGTASAKQPAARKPKQIPKRQAPLRSPTGISPTAKRAAIPNPAARKHAPVRLAAAPLSTARHLGPNPGVVSPLVAKSNAGAIDGKQVHRRP